MKLSFEYACLGRGLFVLSAFQENFASSVGTLWFMPKGQDPKTADVFNCYVIESMRKQGIARALAERLSQDYQVLTTGITGSTAEGSAVLPKVGAIQHPDLNIWVKNGIHPTTTDRRSGKPE